MATQLRGVVELLRRSAEALLLAAQDQRRLAVATEMLGAQYGYGARYVLLHDPLSRQLYVGGAAGQIVETTAIKGYRRPDGAGLSGWCWTSGELVNVPDVHTDPQYMEVLPSCRSEICVPITAGHARARRALRAERPRWRVLGPGRAPPHGLCATARDGPRPRARAVRATAGHRRAARRQ